LASFRSAVSECRRQIANAARRLGVVQEEDSEVSYVGLEGVVSQHTGLQPFVRLRSAQGNVYSAANEFLRDVEALKRQQLSRREPRETARPWDNDAPVRPITSFHMDSRYGGDLHRADMAWAVHAAARGLSREQIEHEILNSRDLSKKGPPLRRLAYAMRTARRAIALAAQ
jgi:hypothetical protein